MTTSGMKSSQRLTTWLDGDLLHPSSLHTSQCSIWTLPLPFEAFDLIVSQTSVLPPSSWQPRNVISLSSEMRCLKSTKFLLMSRTHLSLRWFSGTPSARWPHQSRRNLFALSPSTNRQYLSRWLTVYNSIVNGRKRKENSRSKALSRSHRRKISAANPRRNGNWATINHNQQRFQWRTQLKALLKIQFAPPLID